MKLRRIINTDYFSVPFLVGGFVVILVLVVRQFAIPSVVWGGVIAGLAGMLTYWVQRLAQTSANRYDALVRLEQQLNLALESLSSNDRKMRDAIAAQGIYLLSPRRLDIDLRDVQEIGRAQLKNILFSLSVNFQRYNEGLEGAIRAFERDQAVLGEVGEDLSPSSRAMYRVSAFQGAKDRYKSHLEKMRQYGDKAFENAKGALIRVRFFLHSDRSRILQHLTTKYYDPQEYEKWLKDDLARVENEIQQKKPEGRIDEGSDN